MKRIILFLSLIVSMHGFTQAQNSVSIGTDNINEDAVLQLISPDNNQGFLAPKMTSSQRQSMSLQNDDDAMLVFDSDLGLFFFWYDNRWIQLSTGSDDDTDPTNEIQDLSLDGTNLSLTGNPSGTVIDLSSYLNTDDQLLDFNFATSQLSIEDGNIVDLSPLIDDADADPANEIQDLQLVDNTLSITNNPTATNIDLSGYLDDTDDQNLSEVLTEGNNAGDVRITNLANPVDPQDAATKAYVDNVALPRGMIVMWSGTISTIPAGWALCNGLNGTPNLTDRFIRSAGSQNPGQTGGNPSQTHSHTVNNHQHTVDPPLTTISNFRVGTVMTDLFGWENIFTADNGTYPTVNIPQFNSGSQTAPIGTDAQNHYPLYYVLAFIMKL